jgi:GNAT superfamily N-acetyltransferase
MWWTSLRIREARLEDCRALGELRVAAWEKAYRGLIPDEILNDLSAEISEKNFHNAIVDPDVTVWVADENAILGYAICEPTRDFDGDPTTTGEIRAIYVHPGRLRSGIGRALMGRALARFVELGFGEATLWVLQANEGGRRFYEQTGWSLDEGVTKACFEGFDTPEVRYRLSLAGAGSMDLE